MQNDILNVTRKDITYSLEDKTKWDHLHEGVHKTKWDHLHERVHFWLLGCLTSYALLTNKQM